MTLPIVGTVNWTWLFIGALVGMFLLPRLFALVTNRAS